MWYIISSVNPDHKYVVLGGRSHSVGRKECDILVAGDATVSRRHAELSMTHVDGNLTNPAKLPVLLLKDLSKFGTWVNSQRVEGDRILSDGDTVQFGSPKSSFMIVYEPLVVTSSCLETPAKKSLRQLLITLGGHMVSEWSRDCCMLVMSKISVTIKVICALVSLKPVVTPSYLEAYLKHLKSNSDKPDPEQFTPVVQESQLDPSEVTFAEDATRTTLFQGMTFVFLSQKQYRKMSLAIELAGGTPLLMEGSGEIGLVTQAGTVVMDCSDSNASQAHAAWIAKVTKALDRAGKHMIADAELGYAILYSSTEKHCNPDYVAGETTLCKLPSQTLSQGEVFVPDSVPQHRIDLGAGTQSSKTRQRSPVKPDPVTPKISQEPGHRRGTQKRGTRGASPVSTDSTVDTIAPSTPQEASHRRNTQKRGTRGASPVSSDTMGDTIAPSTPQEAGHRERNQGLKRQKPGETSATRVTVKEEVPSQPSQTRRKRGRIIEDDDSEEETVSINKRVKTEPITPNKKPETPVATKNGNKDTKKTTATIVEDSAWGSDDDDIDYSKIDLDESVSAAQGKTSPRRSPRHSLSRQEQTETKKGNKKSRSRSRSRSRSPHEPARKPLIKTETLSFVVADDDDDSEKEKVSKVSRPKESKSEESRQKESRSEESRPKESRSEESRSVVSRSSQRAGVTRSEEGEKTDDSSRNSRRRRMEESDEDDEVGTRRPVNINGPAPAGFLRAAKSEQAPPSPTVKTEAGSEAEAEADLPRGCGHVELVSLVVRRPKPHDPGAGGDCPDGYTRWKGKVIKNFKKFRKTTNRGADGLPKIIGGSDLEVHQGSRSKEMDEWMKESMQAESQHTAEDRRAQAMFEFNPRGRKKGRQ